MRWTALRTQTAYFYISVIQSFSNVFMRLNIKNSYAINLNMLISWKWKICQIYTSLHRQWKRNTSNWTVATINVRTKWGSYLFITVTPPLKIDHGESTDLLIMSASIWLTPVYWWSPWSLTERHQHDGLSLFNAIQNDYVCCLKWEIKLDQRSIP